MGTGGKDVIGHLKDEFKPSQPQEEIKKEIIPEEDWTEDQQKLLETGLKKYPKTLDPKERWGSISKEVGTKSAKECLARFKYLAAKLKK